MKSEFALLHGVQLLLGIVIILHLGVE